MNEFTTRGKSDRPWSELGSKLGNSCTGASTKYEYRSGRPVEVTTLEMIDKTHDMVLSDRRIKVREIVNVTSIS